MAFTNSCSSFKEKSSILSTRAICSILSHSVLMMNANLKSPGGDWDLAFNTYITKLGELQAFGAKNILFYGMYKSHPNTDILQNRVFSALLSSRHSKTVNGTNFAFVNLERLERLFTAIANDPESFRYKGNATCLISANTILGGCDDPDHIVFWIWWL
ncbi:hypothetical protein K435DRAFT_811053 [Dendrothele bispora CBS 962.96]|uniref:Uncharacterized protein n=1 Tax=Dendrothele bispora (strain CBS 962.96) TaxID=1314807 RepID=A0A4S8KT67_DENBC|nr:hypothetical protein K435DRAFT_811053 [Dendrothele bispora CBS 962.96]